MRCYTGPDAALRQIMYQEIAQCLKEGRRAYLLVPEQYTLEAELEAFEVLGLSGSFDFQVLSPARLFSRTFEASGRPPQARVDERGRVTLLTALMDGLELTRYKNAQRRPGFVQRMAAEIARCKQTGLTPLSLREAALSMGPCALTDKLSDTAAVWEVYERELEGRFLDGEDERFRALERLPHCDFLENARLWARGFELVSPALADILCALDKVCEQTALLAPCSDGRDRDCWQPVEKSLERLAERFGGGMTLRRIAGTGETGSETAFFAREMSAYPTQKWQKKPEHISVFALKTCEEEADFAVGRVRELVRKNGWRYRDCAILCENMVEYADRLNRAAALYGVPLFAEEQRCALSHPAAQYLLLALRLVRRGYPADAARLLLRTGYTGLNQQECDILSNYIYEYGIRGSLWKKPFSRGENKGRAQQAEPLRERFIAPFLALEGRLKEAHTAREILTALWQLADEAGLQKALETGAQKLFDDGYMVEASESAQVWNRIVGEFDQLNELLGEKKLKPQDVERLLEAGLGASQITPLPQSNDAVCAASISRVRARPFKAIVLIGASDAQPIRDEGLFDDGERMQLSDISGAWFPPDGDGRVRLRALDYKNAVALAGESLTITYPIGPSGDRSSYGYPVRWARRVFPELSEGSPEEALRTLYCAPEAASVLSAAARDSGGDRAEGRLARSALREAGPFAPVSAAPNDGTLDANLARKLYGGPGSVSVSRLETFAACPFHHFVQYGLRPFLMRPYEYEAQDQGTLMHRAMETIFQNPPASPEEAARIAREVVESLSRTEQSERMLDDPLAPGLLAGLMRRASFAADAAVFQLQGSAFRVAATEMPFGLMNPLVFAQGLDAAVPIEGRIDRIDLWRDAGRSFARVVDYKSSSSQSVDLMQLYHGLQLQLPVYLAAACMDRKARPAGAYYFPTAGKIPETDETGPETIRMTRRKNMALKGITAGDMDILTASSPNLSEVLGITITQKGEPAKSGKVVTAEQLAALSDFALRKAGQFVDAIRRGDARVDPVRCGQYTSCRFCEFAAICRVDGKITKLPGMSHDEALEMIMAEE